MNPKRSDENIRNEQKQEPIKKKIKSVSDYINEINCCIQKNKETDRIFLYRGENKFNYNSSCIPNIFRRDDLFNNAYYEKSLFNAIRQNKLSQGTTFLENAIDAQHGEFPSRLLDVSYNSLIALYFAVTPYYHYQKDITRNDDKDGVVFIFYVDRLFSPSAQNTINNYDAIINKNVEWFDNLIFSKVHKVIDHTKINKRIIAQQGAFILFQGNDAERIPPYMFDMVEIDKEAKPRIRKELNMLFGLNKSFVFPEIMNYADDLSSKNRIMNTEDFNIKNEMNYVLNTFSDELTYYKGILVQPKEEKQNYDKIQKVEMEINSYKIGIIDFINNFYQNGDNDDSREIVNNYNKILDNFINQMRENSIEISHSLRIETN